MSRRPAIRGWGLATAGLCCILLATIARPVWGDAVVIGSKAFAESWILGEAATILLRDAGTEAEHRQNLGGTEIVYEALRAGAVDLYPEYTGTIAEVLLKTGLGAGIDSMRVLLAREGIGIGDPLGFNDSYALAMRREGGERLRIESISDLSRHPELRVSLSHEFLGREDGWPGLSRRYGLAQREVQGIQHDLAYQAIATGRTDVIDIYTTDAQIEKLGLIVLRDDLAFFPRYDAVFLYRMDLRTRAPEALAAVDRLAGKVSESAMIRANAKVVFGGDTPETAARSLLADALDRPAGREPGPREGVLRRILANTLVHLQLVVLSLLAAVVVGLPLGIAGSRSRRLGESVLWITGLLQTIPSLVLLALLIPILGIGTLPSLAALFLYSLLPIVRNTHVGLTTIPRELAESAEALGLSPLARLVRIDLPIASPAIVAGIKTSAVINVGTATLAALIGAGGLGSPILQGIALRDTGLILQGALPAAGLALLLQWGLDLMDPIFVPRGLRLPRR